MRRTADEWYERFWPVRVDAASLTASAAFPAAFLTCSAADDAAPATSAPGCAFFLPLSGSTASRSAWTIASLSDGFSRCSMSDLPGCCALWFSIPTEPSFLVPSSEAADERNPRAATGLAGERSARRWAAKLCAGKLGQ